MLPQQHLLLKDKLMAFVPVILSFLRSVGEEEYKPDI